MEGPNNTRPRARSEATQQEHASAGRARASTASGQPPTFQPSQDEDLASADRVARREEVEQPQSDDIRSPRRERGLTLQPTGSNLRRRATRRTNITADTGRSTQSNFNLAGPDDTSQLRQAHEPYVNPGYADLNPAYDQPANTKPVWSLAKPLPRVVRPGMVPTKQEIIESRINPELPAENSQKAGVDVDPNDLEAGNLQSTANPKKVAAQVEDARLQRENTYLNNLNNPQRRGTSLRPAATRLSGEAPQISGRRRRASTLSALPEVADSRPSMDGAHPISADDEGPFPRPSHVASDLRPIEESPEADSRAQSRKSESSDTISMTTLGVDDGLDNDMFPLMTEHYDDDEIHNVHTVWSVVRIKHREFLAELLAVVVQLTFGFCSDLSVQIAEKGNPNTTAWAWGFATMIGIYISGGISGAHLNPVITAVLWFFRGFPKRKMPEYFLAQFLGAFIAGFISYGLYYASIQDYLSTTTTTDPTLDIINSFVTSPRETWIDAATAFFNEFIGTAFLVITVLSLGDDQNAPPGAGMNAFIIGLVIVVENLAFAFQTGIAANPSRDFGPRLALLMLGYGGNRLFVNPYWFYGPWAGALCGGFVGGLLYDVAIFTGGESPINYPWSRTKRAAHKSKVKWTRRLHLDTKEEKLEGKE